MDRYMIVIPAKNRAFNMKCDDGDSMKLVGGPIEPVPALLSAEWAREKDVDGILLLVNEEGLMKERPLTNQRASEMTAAELKDKGLFGSEGTVHECYRKRGGVYKPGGVTRMEMELCQKRIRHPMKLPDQPAKVKRKPIGGVIDPSALAYDVHDLMIYNEKARKIGKPELTYGYWAEKGKPATP